MEFSRQEYWNRHLFHSLADLPDPRMKPRSPALQADLLLSESPGKLSYVQVTFHPQQTVSKLGKRVHQGYILSPCLFNLYAEHIMQNAGLDEAQAGIKIAGKNINNLRHADDTTLMAESEEELKSLLMKVKEELEKASLKLNIQTSMIMASGPITSWHIGGHKMETVTDFIVLGFKITMDGDCSHEIKRRSLEEKL